MQPCRNLWKANNRWRLSALTLALTISFSNQTVYAQSGNVLISTANNPMDPVIVTATRTPTRANDVLADYVLIGPEEIADAGQTSLVELLQRQRGVEISTIGGPGSAASVFLRGSNSNQALLLVDGVRSQAAGTGGFSLQAIPLGIIDRIEIIFGPQSSLYGSDAIGGVIQIFTKKGTGPFQANASTGYGGYGTSITDASLYGSFGDTKTTSYAISGSQEISTGFNSVATNNRNALSQNRTGYTKSGGAGRIAQEWDRGQEFGFQFLASRLDNQYPVSSFYGGGIGSQISNLGIFSIFSNNQINKDWKSMLQVSQSNDYSQNLYSTGNPVYKTKQMIYSWQNDIKIGSDLLQLVAERKTLSGYSNDGGVVSQNQNTNTVAGSYQLKRGSHLANLALRNDSITGYGPQTTGSASYGYFFSKQIRGNINYGTGFKAPSFNDLYFPDYGNTNLQAEKSKNTEIGLHYESSGLDLHLIGFNSTITNLIQYTTTTPPCTIAQLNGPNYGCAGNAGVAKISGVSVGGIAKLSSLRLKASYDQQNPIDQTTGFLLAKRARQFGNLGAEYRYQKLNVGAEGTFQGGRYNSGNSSYMGGYAIFNLYGNYEFAKDWSIFGRWNNIFNKDYQLSYGYNTPGSNLFIGVRYAMK
ncbi:TonB-dependent receptor [Polynucleobacter sp. HIN8]|uniref:TonB-dependent receptor domain-containing protein n=1 Tax=Polynucleobacter sp. HIN8 TaxID=3047867 RepID=UPI0025741F65|nr:TonB-dependent receptor [Polynucleobacter sp. HIN8]BEI39687.1 TonB-dependent receptor [Polynucleobacter sp. HIN8]